MRVAWARERFWLIPLACTVVAVGLGLGFIALDRLIRGSIQLPFLISSGVDGARAMLSAIAGSMITFAGPVQPAHAGHLRRNVCLCDGGAPLGPRWRPGRGVRPAPRSQRRVSVGAGQRAGLPVLHPPHRPVHSSGDDHRLDRCGHPGPLSSVGIPSSSTNTTPPTRPSAGRPGPPTSCPPLCRASL